MTATSERRSERRRRAPPTSAPCAPCTRRSARACAAPRLARTPARITTPAGRICMRMSLRMGIDVWPRCAHATQCLWGMGGGAWSGLGGAGGVLERVVHLLRSLRRSRPAVCSLRRLGVWAEIPHVRGAERAAFRLSLAGGEPFPVYGLVHRSPHPLAISLFTVRVERVRYVHVQVSL
jgi:hypothetical protein